MTTNEIPIGAVRNKHPSRCHKCHQWIRPLEGFVFRERPGGRWVGEHNECPEMDGANDDSPWHDLYSAIHDGS